MSKWTKLVSGKHCGRSRRDTFAVRRNGAGSRIAYLVIPAKYHAGAAASIYTDGNGKLAFEFGETGEYVVRKPSGAASISLTVIPSEFAEHIPFGTTEANVVRDGDMLILDLKQFAAK